MSRTVIAAVVALVIAVLTAVAFFVTATSFDDRLKKDAEAQLDRAFDVVQQLNQLRAIDVQNKAGRLGAYGEFVRALKSDRDSARLGFQKFLADEREGKTKPDLIALVDASGDLVAMTDVRSPVAKQWKNEKGESLLPAVNVALGSRVIVSDVWNHGDLGLMKVGVAPIIDPDAPVSPKDPDGVVIIGAVVVAYSQTAQATQMDRRLLGTELAYYDKQKVVATSFTRGSTSQEDTAGANGLNDALSGKKIEEVHEDEPVHPKKITIGGVDYLAAAVVMPRRATKKLPDDYPASTAGVAVLARITPQNNIAGTIEGFIVLLGVGSLALALLGVFLAHRRVVAQVDQIETGVTEIINGNVDRTFRPVGPELDGLANGLNVMLARLLGRPEPGEEEFDEEGNQVVQGRVEFEETEGQAAPAPDSDLAALAQESEPDYYKRVYTEYQAAKRALGTPDDGSFENFIAKLKVNEGKLKAQYNCRAVRFRVVTKDGKVTLKPVPMYA